MGQWGEIKASQFLKKNGYKILTKNFRNRHGEIDIIAILNEFLVFIEVKTRRSTSFGLPQASVDFSKQQKIKKIARYYLIENNIKKLKIRFDVITINIQNGKAFLNHITNAF